MVDTSQKVPHYTILTLNPEEPGFLERIGFKIFLVLQAALQSKKLKDFKNC
jgi:hypothetical protein